MIRIFPMPVANYRIDGKDLFTENQMHSYAIQCQEAVEEQKNKNRIDPCSIYLSKPSAQETPPKREWIGLTLDEIYDSTHGFTRIQKDDWVATDTDIAEFAHIIEARLKAKNT